MKTTICAYCRQEVPDSSYCLVCGAPLIKTERDLVGQQIQSYHIERLVGEGASGRLYRASHIATRQVVALKVLQPELATNPKSIRRFRREAEVGIRLQHPHAVKLFEFGIDKGIGLFTVMELIQGKSLREQLKEAGHFTPQRALTIALQMCDVLEKAHSLSIIHRDLKPANVLMEWHPDSNDFVKVCDFGLAKMELPSSDETRLTIPGTIYGTPGYMSPEQCLGEESDGRTDLYALGVTIYEMLTGRLPFAGNTPLELIMRPLQSEPLQLRRALPELQQYESLDFLEEVVMKCLARSPKDRHANAQSLKLDLQMCLPSTLPMELSLTPSAVINTPAPPTAFPWEPIRVTHEQLDYCRELMHAAPTQNFLPSQTIFQQEQVPSRFYLIKSGQVRILSQALDHIVELDRLGPGDFLGVGPFFSRSPYTLTAEAAAYSEIHIIDRNTFTTWLQKDARLQSLFHHFYYEYLQQEVIRYAPFFAQIPPQERSNIIKSLDIQPIGRGQEIVQQGEPCSDLYLIASGQMEVYWQDEKRDNTFNTRVLRGGDFFGELSILTGKTASASVRSLSNAILIKLPRTQLFPLLEAYPSIRSLLQSVAEERMKENAASSLDEFGDTIPI